MNIIIIFIYVDFSIQYCNLGTLTVNNLGNTQRMTYVGTPGNHSI